MGRPLIAQYYRRNCLELVISLRTIFRRFSNVRLNGTLYLRVPFLNAQQRRRRLQVGAENEKSSSLEKCDFADKIWVWSSWIVTSTKYRINYYQGGTMLVKCKLILTVSSHLRIPLCLRSILKALENSIA